MKQLICVFMTVLLFALAHGATYTILAGSASGQWALTGFFPANITIQTGDSIAFTASSTPVAVAFSPNRPPVFTDSVNFIYNSLLQPNLAAAATVNDAITSVSSGILQSATFTFTFPNNGAFLYWDIINGAGGAVTVASSPAPATPGAIASSGAAILATTTASLGGFVAGAGLTGVGPFVATTGAAPASASVFIAWGYAGTQVSFQQFVPNNFTVFVGDTVKFVNADWQPHAVALNGSGGTVFCTSAYPAATAACYAPSSVPVASSFAGTSFVSSGLLTGGAAFSLTFSAVGVFVAVDATHGTQATINVLKPPPAIVPAGGNSVSVGRAFGQIGLLLLVVLIISSIGILLVLLIDIPCHEIFACCCSEPDTKGKK